jgi:septal ring factor EnvC (AmiA/AmiB activator)
VREDRSEERSLLIELERAAHALEETIGSLGEEALVRGGDAVASGFASLRGELPLPVRASIARGFGRVVDAEFQTATVRKGVDFAAAAGEPVRAVADGLVRFAGWFRGYGRMVILDHGDDYFSVSGHLDEVRVGPGERVDARDVIGTVGETGSLEGPRLYFEIRHGREPLDPADWLASKRPG